MDIFRQHEVFEIEVLDRMNSAKLLEPLVFGGGTMLRLCHELERYSVDLDFWFIKSMSHTKYFNRLVKTLENNYEVTDAGIKHYTLLVELRSSHYPRRLKVEIRKELKDSDYQAKIAFSRASTKQVLLKAHTLEQTMKNKLQAFLDRGEIRDCYDIEFLLRRGTCLPIEFCEKYPAIRKKIGRFKDVDFKVTLGSILEKDIRNYYVKNRFSLLNEKLAAMMNANPKVHRST